MAKVTARELFTAAVAEGNEAVMRALHSAWIGAQRATDDDRVGVERLMIETIESAAPFCSDRPMVAWFRAHGLECC